MFRKSWILLAPFVSLSGCDGFESESRGRAYEAIAETVQDVAETVQDVEAVEELEILQEAESEERQSEPGDSGGELMAPVKVSEADAPHAPYALLVSAAAEWKYLSQGTTCAAPANNNWKGGGTFDDGTWVVGRAELGYGDGDEQTAIPAGGTNASNKCITQYFRHTFPADRSLYNELRLQLLRDDGAAVYLNGTRIVLSNLPQSFGATTVASSTVEDSEEDTFIPFANIDENLLRLPNQGDNVIAVEVHQRSKSNPDLSFNLELVGVLGAVPAGDMRATTAPIHSAEATIDESIPDTKLGNNSACKIDGMSGDDNSDTEDQVCLARWTLPALPSGATIRAAHIEANVTNTTPDRYQVYKLNPAEAWVENAVTWNRRSASSAWTAPNEPFSSDDDLDQDVLTAINAPSSGRRFITLPVELVQGWLGDPATNQGVAFFNTVSRNGLDFSTGSKDLRLVITYDF